MRIDDRPYHLPDDAVDVALQAVAEVVGISGIRSILVQAKLQDYLVDGRLAPGKTVEFQHVGQVTQALLDVYGVRGSGAMLRRAGRVQFDTWRQTYPGALGVAEIALKALPPMDRIKTVLRAVKIAAKQLVSVDTVFEERNNKLYFATFQCPYCSGIHTHEPFCLTAIGALEAVTAWTTGERWRVKEIACRASGADACAFEITPLGVDA